jgi:hypothetical protein
MSATLDQETVELNRAYAGIYSTVDLLDGGDLSCCGKYIGELSRHQRSCGSEAEIREFIKDCADHLCANDPSMLMVVYNLVDAVGRARATRIALKRHGR